MKVRINIQSDVASIQEAEELKNKMEDLLKLYGLQGSAQGDKYPSGAAYNGIYMKQKQKKKKAAPPKFDPKYDPSQYLKGKPAAKKEVKKEVKKEE